MASSVDSAAAGVAASSTEAAVRVRGLTVRYGDRFALQDVGFDVPSGALFAILGPNGSGKSTLIKAILGLISVDQGEIAVLGREPAGARRIIGYVPQASGTDWAFPVTVRDVVAMGRYGLRPRWRLPFRRETQVERAMAAVDVQGLAGRQVSELSGGQQRRVMVARALARDPAVLVLDEPAAGLDAAADYELTALLRKLANGGRTVIVATHDIAGVADMYDHALLLAGRVIASGTVAEVLTDAHLHEAFGRQLLALHGVEHAAHHDVTFHQEDH